MLIYYSHISNVSNTSDSVSSEYPNTEKIIENMMHIFDEI